MGLIPNEHYTGGKQRFAGLGKQGNRLLRFLLMERHSRRAAGTGSASLASAGVSPGRQEAQATVARELIIRIYVMLRDKIRYAESCRRGSHAGRPGASRLTMIGKLIRPLQAP